MSSCSGLAQILAFWEGDLSPQRWYSGFANQHIEYIISILLVYASPTKARDTKVSDLPLGWRCIYIEYSSKQCRHVVLWRKKPFCREVGIPQTSTRTKPSQDAWLSLPALDSASESPFFCWWWVRHPWNSAPWADCSCQFWPFLDHFLAPRLVAHAFVKASKTFFPVFYFFWMGVPLVAPRALVHWPSWQLCEHIHWEHHCGTKTLCWPVFSTEIHWPWCIGSWQWGR